MSDASPRTDRRRLREIAVQILAHCDAHGPEGLEDLPYFVSRADLGPQDAGFVRSRVEAVIRHWQAVDDEIIAALRNWDLPRVSPPDRAVLRLAVGELLFTGDTPPRVAIDEAVELARTYGAAESPQFVNGVLDAVYHKHHNPPADSGAQDPDAARS